ncbi:YoaK family protein [Mycolicibacterium mucogenicum]|uniref:YoaK family protein n=1 Tax=Mycolicibacterium mucogenicum TaxID=56689 RepID=UPI00076A9F59|nr:YoaK family protein [Mycolicibacterium mucogenicum]MCX8558080.1 YoaK family protein [Mycolicibacterium mucogenicum]
MDEQSPDRVVSKEAAIGPEARLSWLLSWLAGMIGAVAFLHSAGYFVTFMTGNTERAVLGWFDVAERQKVSGAGPQAALWLMACFLAGVFVASFLRRRYWQNHPHGATALVTFGLLVASVVELYEDGWYYEDVNFTGILIICFSVGALNTSFVKNGEVAVPLSYVTGTVVKLGQGLERHICGKGTLYDWLGYLALLGSFMIGAGVGGGLADRLTGPQLIGTVGIICGATTLVTFFHSDKRHREPEQAPEPAA